MQEKNLRYIVILYHPKDIDGRVFKNYQNAKEYCKNAIKEKLAKEVIIGTYYEDDRESSIITNISKPAQPKIF